MQDQYPKRSDLTKWPCRSMPASPLLTGRTVNNYSWPNTIEKVLKHGLRLKFSLPHRDQERVYTKGKRDSWLPHCPSPRPKQHQVEKEKERDRKHNSHWEYVNESSFVLTSLWKELWVNLFEGFFVNNTAGAFLEKVVEKQYEQSVHKINFLYIFKKQSYLPWKAAPRKLTIQPLLQRE